MNLPKTIAMVALFWAMQVVAQLFFKWGSDTPGRAVLGFVSGQAFGVTSIVLLMLLYKTMNPNVALGVCFGGAFLAAQIALAVGYRTGLATTQYVGIVAIAAGMTLLAAGKH
jgi:multidrug transporter EmrE-like cation transporter